MIVVLKRYFLLEKCEIKPITSKLWSYFATVFFRTLHYDSGWYKMAIIIYCLKWIYYSTIISQKNVEKKFILGVSCFTWMACSLVFPVLNSEQEKWASVSHFSQVRLSHQLLIAINATTTKGNWASYKSLTIAIYRVGFKFSSVEFKHCWKTKAS